MAAIHGRSVEALHFFRQQTAALEVYWIYEARANYERVAWPSLRKLSDDTQFHKDTCGYARLWLVEHGALDDVLDYVRPAWRKLPVDVQERKLAMDKSFYGRPTGVLVVDGVTYPLMYFGDSDVLPDRTSDVLPDRTSDVLPDRTSHVLPGRTELDSIEGIELDSNELGRSGELGGSAAATIFDLYEQSFGVQPGNRVVIDELVDMLAEFGMEVCAFAFREMALSNVKNLKYVRSICERLVSGGGVSGVDYASGKFADFIYTGEDSDEA